MALEIKPSEIQRTTIESNNSGLNAWSKWLLFILGDIALSLATWYIGGFAGHIALALQTTTEAVNIGLQLTRIGLEVAYNLGMDYESLTHQDGSLNWNTIFLRSIFILGVEGLPQLTQNIRWLKQVNKLDKFMIEAGVDKPLRQQIKMYSKDFAMVNQLRNLDKVGELVLNSDRLILESGASTFGLNGSLNPLIAGFQAKNVKKQIKNLFGNNIAKQYEKEVFKSQVQRISESILSWNTQLEQTIEKIALFKSLKYTPKYVRAKILKESTIKYIGFDEVNGISKINLFLSVTNQWLAGLKYLNPYIASRKLARGIVKGINRVINPPKKVVEKITEKIAGGTLEDKAVRETFKVPKSIALKYTNEPSKISKVKDFTSDLLERKGKQLINWFGLIPVQSSWILGYRIIFTEIGACIHIFFRPEQTMSKINGFKGKPPIVTHPLSVDELLAWTNAESYGRFYLDNFAYAFDWHKYGILLTVGVNIAPFKIQNTLWNVMRIKRTFNQTAQSIRRIEQWSEIEWDRLMKDQFFTALVKKTASTFTGFSGYINPFLNGLIRGKGFWAMSKELGGRRAGVYVRRVRRRHHKIGLSDITPNKINKHSKSKLYNYKKFKY